MNSILDNKLLAISRLDLKDTIIAVDFDGTCVFHDFPKVGASVPYAREVLLALTNAGAKLIVWTIRSDQAKIKNDPHSLENGTAGQDLDMDFLRAAINWFTVRGIQLYGHNINPQQCEWSSSPKCYAHLYIDDAALGCPLYIDQELSERPFVDWLRVADLLISRFPDREGGLLVPNHSIADLKALATEYAKLRKALEIADKAVAKALHDMRFVTVPSCEECEGIQIDLQQARTEIQNILKQ